VGDSSRGVKPRCNRGFLHGIGFFERVEDPPDGCAYGWFLQGAFIYNSPACQALAGRPCPSYLKRGTLGRLSCSIKMRILSLTIPLSIRILSLLSPLMIRGDKGGL